VTRPWAVGLLQCTNNVVCKSQGVSLTTTGTVGGLTWPRRADEQRITELISERPEFFIPGRVCEASPHLLSAGPDGRGNPPQPVSSVAYLRVDWNLRYALAINRCFSPSGAKFQGYS
jgi:hypothetical protein